MNAMRKCVIRTRDGHEAFLRIEQLGNESPGIGAEKCSPSH